MRAIVILYDEAYSDVKVPENVKRNLVKCILDSKNIKNDSEVSVYEFEDQEMARNLCFTIRHAKLPVLDGENARKDDNELLVLNESIKYIASRYKEILEAKDFDKFLLQLIVDTNNTGEEAEMLRNCITVISQKATPDNLGRLQRAIARALSNTALNKIRLIYNNHLV